LRCGRWARYLTLDADIADYARVRSRYLGDMRPGVHAARDPRARQALILVEIEVSAAKR